MLDILLPETASAPRSARVRYAQRSVASIAGFAICMIGPGLVDLGEFGVAVSLLGLGFIGWLIFEFVVLVRSLDELQFKIHVTSLAIAGGAIAVLSTLWSIAAVSVGYSEPSPAFALPAVGASYYLALFFVTRHYS